MFALQTTKLPLLALKTQTRSLRFSLPVPPLPTHSVQVQIVSDYSHGQDVALSSASGPAADAPSASALVEPEDGTTPLASNPTDAEAAVHADRGPLPDKSGEALRLKWNEIEVKPGGPLGRKVIVEKVITQTIVKE